MRALKTLVIGLGVVILLLFTLLIWGILRLGGGREPQGPQELQVSIPAGCSLAEARVEEGHVLLRLEGLPGRDCQQVLLLDAESGALRKRLRLVNE